jgi:hypothetical protein
MTRSVRLVGCAVAKLGRSLLAGETSVDELRKLTKKFKIAKHYMRNEPATFGNVEEQIFAS